MHGALRAVIRPHRGGCGARFIKARLSGISQWRTDALSMLVTRGRQHRLSFVRVLERVRHDWHAGIRIDQHTEYVGGSDGQPTLQL